MLYFRITTETFDGEIGNPFLRDTIAGRRNHPKKTSRSHTVDTLGDVLGDTFVDTVFDVESEARGRRGFGS